MDFSLFKLDIDDLLNDFCEANFLNFGDMKRLWASKKFSFIYEARPTSNPALFMQTLYAHCISFMSSEGPLSRKLGGLYCLYCVYETQPYKPCFKIYLSVGELKSLRLLVIESKEKNVGVVAALVKRMLDRSMFLFGAVDITEDSLIRRVEDATKLQNKLIKIAYEKLLGDVRIEEFLYVDMGAELGLEEHTKISMEYSQAKDQAIAEAGITLDVGDIKHIGGGTESAAEKVEEIVREWDNAKEELYERTSICCPNQAVAVDDFYELQQLLGE